MATWRCLPVRLFQPECSFPRRFVSQACNLRHKTISGRMDQLEARAAIRLSISHSTSAVVVTAVYVKVNAMEVSIEDKLQ